jgi:hypothetical protein
MGLRELEASILRELRAVTGINKIRQKDIMQWSTATFELQAGETMVYLPSTGVHVCYKLPDKKEKK